MHRNARFVWSDGYIDRVDLDDLLPVIRRLRFHRDDYLDHWRNSRLTFAEYMDQPSCDNPLQLVAFRLARYSDGAFEYIEQGDE